MIKVQQARPTITWALLAFAILVAFAALILVPVWLEPPLSKADLSAVAAGDKRVTLQQAQAQLQNSVRSTLLQGLAGVLVIAGAVATWRQVQVSREGQITDRLTHAIDPVQGHHVLRAAPARPEHVRPLGRPGLRRADHERMGMMGQTREESETTMASLINSEGVAYVND